MIKFSKFIQHLPFRITAIFCLTFLSAYMLSNISNRDKTFITTTAYSEAFKDTSSALPESKNILESNIIPLLDKISSASGEDNSDDDFTVQAVLGAKRQIVIASGINSKITRFKLESGDRFKRGDILIQYDCTVDRGRLSEALSRQRVTQNQLAAYQRLLQLGSVSDIELMIARENNEQNKAMITQIEGRLKSCQHVAPWNGRVMRKMASQYEYVQTGRVLMEIASHDPLRAEFLIPSRWLRWLNVGTPLEIYIGETDKKYDAKIVSIFGEVDPVSQSIQVVAQMEKYHEDLLPGMSGRASFAGDTDKSITDKGFLGLSLASDEDK
jgi:RND family efflux transporter MFP subunit